ncbi:MAG: hypothetical protein ACHQDE_05590 [Acidimicrobiia bacterium]
MSAAESQTSGENGDVELTDTGEAIDTEDAVDEDWAPGEPPVGLATDEVLHVHVLTEREPSADELDVGDDALELPTPDEDEPLEDGGQL